MTADSVKDLLYLNRIGTLAAITTGVAKHGFSSAGPRGRRILGAKMSVVRMRSFGSVSSETDPVESVSFSRTEYKCLTNHTAIDKLPPVA
jgi:hypothetical protein